MCTGRNPLHCVPVLFLCGSAPPCWRRRWLLHPGETSHNLSHIQILSPFLSQEDSASSQHSASSPCPCWAGLMESHGSQSPGAPWLGRGRAGDTTREAFGAAAPSGDGGSGRAGGSVPAPGCPAVAGPSSASCAGRTPSSSAPAPAASSAAAPPPPAPAPCWPWRQPGRALRPGSECPARKGTGLETGQCPASTERGS